MDILEQPPQSLHKLSKVAAYLDRSTQAVRRLIRVGNIEAVREGHKYYIQTCALQAYIEKRKVLYDRRIH